MTEGKAAPAAATEADSRNLSTRIIAAAVLIPVAIGIAYAGGWLWTALVTLAAVGLYIEWLMVVNAAAEKRVVATGIAALVVAGFSVAVGRIDGAVAALAIGLVAVALMTPERRWAAAGFLYAGVAEFASVLLRYDAVKGFVALIFVLMIVWVTDSGGDSAGCGIGGRSLWPRVSPKKTWPRHRRLCRQPCGGAPLCGARSGKAGPLLMIGGVLWWFSQLGDLFDLL